MAVVAGADCVAPGSEAAGAAVVGAVVVGAVAGAPPLHPATSTLPAMAAMITRLMVPPRCVANPSIMLW